MPALTPLWWAVSGSGWCWCTFIVVAVAWATSVPQAALAGEAKTDGPAGAPLQDAGVEPQYQWIPGGSFRYGCEELTQCREGARPPTGLTHVTGFQITRSRVSHEEYAACVASGACSSRPTHPWCTPTEATAPVTCVDLANAQAYCAWNNALIPTERQWEYAADSGYDMDWWNTSTQDRHSSVHSEWVRPSEHVQNGYAPTRGGLADMEPIWLSDRGYAQPDHRSKSIGFHCVKTETERQAAASPPVIDEPQHGCLDLDPPFLSPDTGSDIVRHSVTVESFYALCEDQSGHTPTRMPLYLNRHEHGEYHYTVAAPCAFQWAFSSAIPGLRRRFERSGTVDIYYQADVTSPLVLSLPRTRRLGDTDLTESPPGDFPEVSPHMYPAAGRWRTDHNIPL